MPAQWTGDVVGKMHNIVALAAGGTYDAATTGMVKKVKEEEFPLEEVVKDA